MSLEPTAVGHVWTTPAVPGYTIAFENHAAANRTVSVVIETKSHDGEETTKQIKSVNLLAGKPGKLPITVPVKKNGAIGFDKIVIGALIFGFASLVIYQLFYCATCCGGHPQIRKQV